MERLAQSGPIVVYGATGYTGRLVASELVRRDAECVLAGRNAAKLDALAAELDTEPETAAVALDDPAGLRRLLESSAAVISCAGPFTLHGEPVLAAAVDTGTHYLDTTGEQTFMRTVFDRYGGPAERAGAAVVTAMGFDYVPGDMIAALTGDGMGPLDEVVLAYSVKDFGMSRGTLHSSLRIFGSDLVEYRDGAWGSAAGGVGAGTWEFPQPVGSQAMIRFPGGEVITVPRHLDTRNVDVRFSAASILPSSHLAPAAGVAMPAVRLAMRTPLRRAADALIDRLPEGPGETERRACRFMISCEARAGTTRRRAVITGSDVYGLTAVSIVHGALLMAAPGYDQEGALAPSQAFDPDEFLTALGEHDVNYEVDPLPVTAAASSPQAG
jgi:short subunit dehydrogenase-like uncharacterized protein